MTASRIPSLFFDPNQWNKKVQTPFGTVFTPEPDGAQGHFHMQMSYHFFLASYNS